LQAARVAASAKLASSLSKSSSPAAPAEEGLPPPSSSSTSIAKSADGSPSASSSLGAPQSSLYVAAPMYSSSASAQAFTNVSPGPDFLVAAAGANSNDGSFSAPVASAGRSLDCNSDQDADASTVVIIEDVGSRSSGCNSDNDDLSDMRTTSSGYVSEGDDESISIDEERTVPALDCTPSDSIHPVSAQALSVREIPEVSHFMGTSSGPFHGDLFHSSPSQWLARLSEAPSMKVVASESQPGDDRHHAVNIVNVRLGILQPVLAHYDTACSAVLSMMRREWCLDAYAQTLQHFHLMEDGAFGDSFASALFDAMDEIPIQRLLPDQFDQLLTHALKSSQSDSHPFAHKLRLRYASFSGQNDQVDAASDGLERLQLILDISDEPAAIVLTKEVMQCYQSVFVLLLRLRRIIRVASRLFWDMPKERGGFRDAQSLEYIKTSGQQLASMRELTLFRHEISHFAHTLQSYLMTQILHISVPELAAQQKGARDLQQLITAHTSFIEVRAFACSSTII
jgi:hypothetical protein